MEWERVTTDALEQELVGTRELQAKLAARQMKLLEELDRRQVATSDGSRSLSEWLAARCDIGVEQARVLVRTMRRTGERPDLRSALSDGVSFDRVEALSRIAEDVGLMEWADINAVRREAAKRVRINADRETTSAESRYLVMQPSLDESSWRLWGELDGHSGEIVDKVLTEKADEIEGHDEDQMSMGWRKATALVETCVADEPAPARVTVIVEAKSAAASQAEAGVTLESGARVGREALNAILCDAEVEVVARTENGQLMEYGRRQRTAPPTLRRALIAEANHTCAVDGCVSRNRLQVHHITPWSQGGQTNPEDLVVLCWFHHHVAVHERGFQITKSPDRRRVRLKKKDRAPPS